MHVKTRFSLKHIFVFACLWAVLTGLSFTLDALYWHKILDEKLLILICFSIIAALITAFIACFLEKTVTRKRPLIARFAAMYFLLAVGTASATYLLSLFYTVSFFTETLGNPLNPHALKDYIFFSLAHGYVFAASTARLFLPLGFLTLGLGAGFYCLLNREHN